MKDVFGKELDFGTHGNTPPTGGHCCRCLTINHAFVDMAESYKAAMAGKQTYIRSDGVTRPNIEDILTIGPMIRLVGVCAENPLIPEEGKFEEPRKVWRCIHQKADYSCAIYETRPVMCRRYPKNNINPSGVCGYKKCKDGPCEYRVLGVWQDKDGNYSHNYPGEWGDSREGK